MSGRGRQHESFDDSSTPANQTTGHFLRHQSSQPTSRAGGSAAPRRTRPQRDLLAPALSRRPVSRAAPVVAHEVREDTQSASEQERERAAQRQQGVRGHARQASPAERTNLRLRPRQQQAEELDIVHRGPDGNYLLGGDVVPSTPVKSFDWDRRLKREFEQETVLARRYFASGEHMKVQRPSRKHGDYDDFELAKPEMVAALRKEATRKIEEEGWMYEPERRF